MVLGEDKPCCFSNTHVLDMLRLSLIPYGLGNVLSTYSAVNTSLSET